MVFCTVCTLVFLDPLHNLKLREGDNSTICSRIRGTNTNNTLKVSMICSTNAVEPVLGEHLPRPPHSAASAALVRACLIHVGGAPTAAVPKAFCAHVPVLHRRELVCFEVHLQISRFSFVSPPWPISWPWLDALAFLHWTRPGPNPWLDWLPRCVSCLARVDTTCLAVLGKVA